MNKKRKIFLYINFAFIAIFANLLTQRIILSIYKTNLFFFLAIVLGTLVGLIIKFILDKNFIFSDRTLDLKSVSGKFGLYTSNGILSTSIFWGTETIFWMIWQKENMREIGAILGLTLGYTLKYRLDKQYVFSKQKK